ncbi:MAG: hypothetical protein A2202_03030 [Bdellovibrionales bacterium RIFOXYA1_FULL_36_14]|nr:MAG: hypothetical protein A2202_03030 [Bdellovibrionales bacterium RIFOXYA1_FULL_36_14]
MNKITKCFSQTRIQFILIALLLHTIVPFFSSGFLHPDEQYYVLDFTFEKLNMIVNYQKSWEYLAGIRSFTLPMLFYCVAWPLQALGIDNPHTLSLIFRTLSSLFAFGCQLYFYHQVIKRYFFKNPPQLFWMLFLAWPLLLMHARTNSENWSTSFFLLALGLLLHEQNKYKAGMFLATAFFIRFQTGFLLLPLFYFFRHNLKGLLKIGTGFLLLSLIFIYLDSSQYQKLVITPLNYLKVNIFEDKVNSFGTNSVFFYAYKTLTKLLPFWGIALISGLLWALKNFPKASIYKDFLILIIPFLIIHHLIGHKELRFLYPLLPFFIFIFAKLIEDYKKPFFTTFMISNFLAYPILFVPLYKPIGIYQYIYNQNIQSIHTLSEQNPFEIKALLPPHIHIEQYRKDQTVRYLFAQNYSEYNSAKALENCIPQKSTYPLWLIENNPYGLLTKSNIWVIFKCDQ